MASKPREKVLASPVMLPQTLFSRIGNAVFQDLEEGVSVTDIAKKYQTNRNFVHEVKRYWIAAMDFGADEPEALARLKDIVKEKAEREKKKHGVPREKQLTIYGTAKARADKMTENELKRQLTTIEGLRIQGVGVVKRAFDRIELLIEKEKSIGSLAKVLSAVLPYVATRMQAADPDKGETIETRRNKFIQNVVNIYNNAPETDNTNTLNIIQDDTDEDDAPERDSAE